MTELDTYVLSVVCDHSRNVMTEPRPNRVVARLLYRPKPDDRTTIGWLEWRELVHEDPGYPPALQTYFGEGRPSGMSDGQRWRFWCADCDDTLLARHSNIAPLLDGLRHAGIGSVTLAGIAPRVS